MRETEEKNEEEQGDQGLVGKEGFNHLNKGNLNIFKKNEKVIRLVRNILFLF